MYRHEAARPDQGEHHLEFFFAAVSRDVHAFGVIVDNLSPLPGYVILQPPDGPLVPGNGSSREHHHIPGVQLHVSVVVDGDSRHRSEGFTLRPGRDAQNLTRWVLGNVAVTDLKAGRNGEVAQLLGDRRVLLDATSDQCHLAVEPGSQVDEDL